MSAAPNVELAERPRTTSAVADSNCKVAGCGFRGGRDPSKCSASAGTLMYSEIREIIVQGGASVVTDKGAAVGVVTWGGDQWVSYDDEKTLRMKADYANNHCLGGVHGRWERHDHSKPKVAKRNPRSPRVSIKRCPKVRMEGWGGTCSGNEVKIAASTDGCWTGHRSLRCSKLQYWDRR